jgi:prevent-host-death family protein
MVTRMGIRELRDTLTQTIRRVRAGETVEVTHDGEPVAMIVPHTPERIASLVAAGLLSPADPFVPPRGQRPARGSLTASAALERDRAGR